jgi:hypothetical protein
MIDRVKLQNLIDMISDLVNQDDIPWIKKRDALLRECDESEVTAILEFAGWFEEEGAKR